MGLKFNVGNINKSTPTKNISSAPKAIKSTRASYTKLTKNNLTLLRSLKVL